ncbi:MAG: hypothetical protein EXR95_05180 [Gemmatimonadetes bacterium]|nr:hypothetical protein [Gemmatimonadota bacterium]
MIASLHALLQVADLPAFAGPTVAGVAALYGAGVAVIAIWAWRRTRTADDFFVAGRGVGLLALTLATLASNISGFAYIGGPGLVYARGLGAAWIILPAGITGALGAWVLAKRLRLLAEVRPMLTIPDALGARYRSRLVQGLAAVAILIAIVGYMAANVRALGVVVDAVFGVGLSWGIWVGALTVVAYSATGGSLSGVYVDVLQGTIMAAASTLVFVFVLQSGGGMGGISRTILAGDPEFLAPWGHLPPLTAASFFFVFGLGVLGQPHVLHKFYMLRDPLRLKWFPLLGTIALVLTVLLFVGVGLAMKALVLAGEIEPLANPDFATPLFLLRRTPLLLAAIVLSGVLAAIMSTVNAFLSVGAAAVTHDLPVALGRRVGDELRWGRWTTVALAVAAAITAQLPGALVSFLGVFGWGLFASTLVPALAVGLNWAGGTRAGAVASIATGLVLTLGLELGGFLGMWTLPGGVSVAGLTLVVSSLVYLGVSALGPHEELDPDVRAVMEA